MGDRRAGHLAADAGEITGPAGPFGGITIASTVGMADEPIAGGHGAEHGAQEVTAGEREARKQAERQQDFQEPAEGRDVPPAEDVKKGTRSPDSPWMGGG